MKKNFYVLNIDKGTYSSNLYNTKDFKNSKKYKYIKLDISNKKILKIFVKYKPSGVFNLAAETHVDRSIDNPGNFIQSNIIGVYNLLSVLKIFQKKRNQLIHISTDEVYGDVLKGRSMRNTHINQVHRMLQVRLHLTIWLVHTLEHTIYLQW